MNINESVTIKLNETGMNILRAEHEELKSAFPSLHDFVEIEPDEDGFYTKKMQLWSVMQTFGPHISLGRTPPFSADIEVSESDEILKLKEVNKELLDALEEAKSVLSSINASWQHKVEVEGDDEPAFWQRNDWVKWAKGEVLQTVETAIAKAKAKS